MDIKKTENVLMQRYAEKGSLVAVHRGTSGGNIVQNTCLAYENALLHGADMIEVDVILSKDNVFYAFHDGVEKLLLGIDEDIRNLTSHEIEALNCINLIGHKVNQRLERLEVILNRFRGRCFINIDRSWFYWKEVIAYLESFHMEDQIILKSPVTQQLLSELQESHSSLMYMPIVKSIEDWNLVETYQVNTVAAELIFETLDHPLISESFLQRLKDQQIALWANAITLDDEIVLSAHLDDNQAIASNPDESWGKLIELGFHIIQTDWPAILNQYIIGRNS